MGVTVLEPPADMFAVGADAIVIPTNCLGVHGAGLALAAKERWPTSCANYTRQCKDGLIAPGSLWAETTAVGGAPLRVLFVATKDHWKHPSRMEWVIDGINAIVEWATLERPKVLAVAAIGCGHGQLAWGDVLPTMLEAFSALPGTINVMVFAPHAREAKPRRRGRTGQR